MTRYYLLIDLTINNRLFGFQYKRKVLITIKISDTNYKTIAWEAIYIFISKITSMSSVVILILNLTSWSTGIGLSRERWKKAIGLLLESQWSFLWLFKGDQIMKVKLALRESNSLVGCQVSREKVFTFISRLIFYLRKLHFLKFKSEWAILIELSILMKLCFICKLFPSISF